MCLPFRTPTPRHSRWRVRAAAEHVKQSSRPPTRWRTELQPNVNSDEQHHVDEQHERAEADPELQRAVRPLEEERPARVVPEEPEHDRRERRGSSGGRSSGCTGTPPRRGSGAGAARPPRRRAERGRTPGSTPCGSSNTWPGSPAAPRSRGTRRERQVEPPALQVGRVERREVVRAVLRVDGSRRPARRPRPRRRRRRPARAAVSERRQPPAVPPRRIERPPSLQSLSPIRPERYSRRPPPVP